MMFNFSYLENLPEIGDKIDVDWALELIRQFPELDYLRDRVFDNKDQYESFIFDGCSCLSDRILGLFNKRYFEWKHITYLCCLPHDLAYAFGKDEKERKMVDLRFRRNLRSRGGMNWLWSNIFYLAVKYFGRESFNMGMSFGFADRRRVWVSKKVQKRIEKLKAKGYKEYYINDKQVFFYKPGSDDKPKPGGHSLGEIIINQFKRRLKK